MNDNRRPHPAGDDLNASIMAGLDRLSPALRQAADYVLANPDDIAMHSLRRVAEMSGVKAPTYSRLAKALGFNDYESLRELCRAELNERHQSFADKAAALQKHKGDIAGSFFISHAATSVRNIEKLVGAIDLDGLVEAAARLARARRVVLIGAMSSAPLVDYVGYTAALALGNWHVAMRGHGPVAADLVDLSKKDAAVVLMHKPYAQVSVDAVARVKDSGAAIVTVTDSFTAPAADRADHLFVTPTDSQHFFASEVATLLLFEALLGMVVRRSGARARQRIAAVERASHRSGEYWQG